jgi:hypothetical protein
MREVVLDIETIPCKRSLWRELGDTLQQKFLRDDIPEREGWKNTALDPVLGRIACVGLLLVEDGEEQIEVFAGSNEARLLKRFWQLVRSDDYIIGHNVLGFDLPFLRARSVVCRVRPTRQFDFRRYSTDTIYDTMQAWAHWDSRRWPRLELLAKILALRGKLGTAREIYDWSRKGQWDKIERYCEQDLRLTFKIFRRLRRYGL